MRGKRSISSVYVSHKTFSSQVATGFRQNRKFVMNNVWKPPLKVKQTANECDAMTRAFDDL
jgi:hypothetical protein